MSKKVRKNFVFNKETLDRLQKIKIFLVTEREENKDHEIISDTKALELLINLVYEEKYRVNWFNDGIHRCGNCETIFKVHTLNEIEEVNFCSVCGSRIDEETDLTEEELEEFED